MKRLIYEVAAFGHSEELAWDELRLRNWLRGLVFDNELYLGMMDREGRLDQVPWLYEAGIEYETDPPGVELYARIPEVIERGTADCKKLSAWRIAELRYRCGVEAKIHFYSRILPNGHRLYHVQVRWPNGLVEDPSKALGM